MKFPLTVVLKSIIINAISYTKAASASSGRTPLGVSRVLTSTYFVCVFPVLV